PNGVYQYGATSAFPTQSYASTNYWVDVVFAQPDATPPVISAGSTANVSSQSAPITWNTDEPSTSRWDYGTSAGALNLNATTPALGTGHSITLTGLTPGVTYYHRVTSAAASGNASTSPPSAGAPTPFTTPAGSFRDSTAADFSAGTLDANGYLSQTGDGEVILNPTVGTEFTGTALPAGWVSTAWNTGGPATVRHGGLALDRPAPGA